MHREYHKWHSPSLNREMELLIFGHHGARMLVFPTSRGKYYEWEDRGMMHALGEPLERGWLQIYCVDSVDAESWYNYGAHPGQRAWRQTQYLNYLVNEVLPLSQEKNDNPFLMAVGASFGAYHAACVAFRYPYLFNRLIALSGMFDIKRFTGGYSDDNVYFNNPMDFMQHEGGDSARLNALQRLNIIIATGRDDALRGESERLASILWRKDIGNALRLWDGWSHDWPYWQKMMQLYVGGND